MNTTTKVAKVEAPAEPEQLSLRDRFAMNAVAGCLCAGRHFDKEAIAVEAYEMADAMLAARKEKA